MSDDNIVEFTGEWQGNDTEMTQAEYETAMEELLMAFEEEELSRIVSGVLEFLTVKAIIDGPYYIMTENKDAVTVFAANSAVDELLNSLPESVKPFDTEIPPFDTNSDPGDEQDEPAPAS